MRRTIRSVVTSTMLSRGGPWLIFAIIGCGCPSLPKPAGKRSSRARPLLEERYPNAHVMPSSRALMRSLAPYQAAQRAQHI